MSTDNSKGIHVLFGPDGSRRWASRYQISFFDTYMNLAEQLTLVARWFFEHESVHTLSLWTLQEYNLQRQESDVTGLLYAAAQNIISVCNDGWLREQNISVKLVGETNVLFEKLSRTFVADIKNALSSAHRGTKTLYILAPYNGSKEILRAITRLKKEGKKMAFSPLSEYSSIPAVNLFIRTGQDKSCNRLSDYFPGIERATLIGSPLAPLEVTKETVHDWMHTYLTRAESFDKLPANQQKKVAVTIA